jgi:hypothetical protein
VDVLATGLTPDAVYVQERLALVSTHGVVEGTRAAWSTLDEQLAKVGHVRIALEE